MFPNKQKPTLMLIDSHALLHRSYHAMSDFYSREGLPSGALYGFLRMIQSARKLINPDYVIACYDLPKPTFRHIAYEDYKGHRAKTDSDLVSQIIESKNFCHSLNIPICEIEGFEADDLLGTISAKWGDVYNIAIVSGDMDTLQLVNDNVRVCTLKKGSEISIFGPNEVLEKYTLSPYQIPDYKGLAGDSSDNIPGVSGIGPKRAIEVLKVFKTVEQLYDAIENNEEEVLKVVKGKAFESIKNSKDEAYFSKTLATIRLDAPVEELLQDAFDYKFGEKYNESQYVELCKKYGLNTVKDFFQKNNLENLNIEINIDELSAPLSKEEERVLFTQAILIDSEIGHPDINKVKDILNENESSNLKNKAEEVLKQMNIWNDFNMYDYYKMLDGALFDILDNMEKRGVLINRDELSKQIQNVEAIIHNLESEIYDLAGKKFLISSPKQLGEILFDDLKLGSKIKKTKTGQRSTGAEQLISIRDEHPIIPKIIYWREISKVFGTYLLPLENYIKSDGAVHPHFIQWGAATGRFACENPNMQNLPRNSESGREFRKIFEARPGYKLVSIDYSQIELRCAAILSGDLNLIEIFEKDLDIHKAVAARVLNKSLEEVNDEDRRKAKAINFGILYGMGVTALQEGMNCDRKTAQEFLNNFKETFSQLINYLEIVKESAKRKGYTETIFGRRRNIPLLKSKLPFLLAQGERIAINAPIQGTAAEVLKLGMLEATKVIQANNLSDSVHMLLQIHDELVFEIKENVIEKAGELLKNSMENVLIEYKNKFQNKTLENNLVPLKVNLDIGYNLFEL